MTIRLSKVRSRAILLQKGVTVLANSDPRAVALSATSSNLGGPTNYLSINLAAVANGRNALSGLLTNGRKPRRL